MLTNRLFRLFTVFMIVFVIAGCQTSPGTDPAATSISDQATQDDAGIAVINDEYANTDAGVSDTLIADALFSISWDERFQPFDSTLVLRSHVFAVAPDTTDTLFVVPMHNGFDMGEVNLSYEIGDAGLNKITTPSGGIFYSLGSKMLGRHFGGHRGPGWRNNTTFGDTTTIPFVAGGSYTFTTTGTDVFPAISLEAVAPTSLISITSHSDFDSVSGSIDLTVDWTGGEAAQPVLIILKPQARPAGPRGPHGPRHGGNNHAWNDSTGLPNPDCSFGGPNLQHGYFSEYALRYLVEDPIGSFTIPAADIQEMLTNVSVDHVMLEVRQLVTREFSGDTGTYLVQFRLGDVVPLNMN